MIRFVLANSGWVVFFSVCSGLVAGLSAASLIAVINMALEGKQNTLLPLGWVFIGLCGLLLITRICAAFLLMRLGQNVIYGLRLHLSRQVLSTSFPRLQKLGASRVLACLTQDVTTLAEAFQWLPMLCVNAAIVIGCLIYMGWLSVPLLVLVILTLVVGITGFTLIEKKALHGFRMARECDDALYGHFRSLTLGLKELKLHQSRRDAFMNEYLKADAKSYRQHYLRGINYFILAGNWGNGLFYLFIGGVLFLFPFDSEIFTNIAPHFSFDVSIITKNFVLSPEVLRGYCLTILFMMSPLEAVVEGIPLVAKGNIAMQKLDALKCDSSEPEFSYSEARSSVRPGALMLTKVKHQYNREGADHPFTLGPISMQIEPGELIFLTGGNGSGKTTLALILVGLYSPEQGDIRLDRQVIGHENREGYRQQFSAVFSDFYLFDSLLGFQEQELDAEVREYLARLQLDHKVRIENGEFSTLDLSQGQRKRLALLVAYLEDRPFYLFDEWAADQDPVFKNIFYTEILPALKAKGKTVIVISHDDQYFHVADRCLRLDEGQLTEL